MTREAPSAATAPERHGVGTHGETLADWVIARYKRVVQGRLGHVGEIAARRTIHERQASGRPRA